jgi:hypothetical protein
MRKAVDGPFRPTQQADEVRGRDGALRRHDFRAQRRARSARCAWTDDADDALKPNMNDDAE